MNLTAFAGVPESQRESALDAEVIWDLRQCETLADEWAALDQLGLCEPCTSLDWTRALLDVHVRDSDTVFAVVLRSAGRVVAIVPAIIRREQVLGLFEVACLSLLSRLVSTQADILRAYDHPGIVAALFSAFARLPCRWDIVRIDRVLESSAIGMQLKALLPDSNLAPRMQLQQPSFYLELGLSFEEFLAARSSKFRNHLRRKSRQLEAAGQVKVLQAGRDLGVEEALDHLLQVEARSWKHTHGTALSVLPRQREFNRLICEGAARRGHLHLLLMYLDDVPIAYDLGITAGDRYSYLKTSFDEAFRRLSPATVLRATLIKTLIAEGVRCIDFPAAPFKWEEQWTNTLRGRYSFVARNRTPRGMLYWLLAGLRDRFQRSPDEEGVQYVDPRQPGLVVEADELAVDGDPIWRGDATGAPAHGQ